MSDNALREQLADLIQKSHAHAGFDAAVKEFPWDKAGVVPPGLSHSVWQLLEHLRIAQNDILEFSRSADHVSPEWPDGYWPRSAGPASESEWTGSASGEGDLRCEGEAPAMPSSICHESERLQSAIMARGPFRLLVVGWPQISRPRGLCGGRSVHDGLHDQVSDNANIQHLGKDERVVWSAALR